MNSVSIAIPIFNTKLEYFDECLKSIANQTEKFNIELIIVDDGSENMYFEKYKKMLEDLENYNSNIKCILHRLDKNYGISYALNVAVDLCTNEIIFRMDSDDIMSPNRLSVQWNFMKQNSDYVLCGGDVRLFKNIDNRIKYLHKTNFPEIVTWEFFKNRFTNNNTDHYFAQHSLFCFRKSAIIKIGNYDKNLRFAEDIDLTARILKKYGKLYNIKIFPVMMLYRQVETSLCNDKDKNEARQYNLNIIYEKIKELL